MKGRLHGKILLALLFILLMTELIVAGLYKFSMHSTHSRFIGEMKIASRLLSLSTEKQTEIKSLPETLAWLARNHNADFWITVDDVITAKSFTGEVPVAPEVLPEGILPLEHLLETWVQQTTAGTHYVTSPVRLPDGNTGFLHAIYYDTEAQKSELVFMQGLLHISLALLLLIIPLSYAISRPLKKLNAAVLQFAKGDLTVRASEKGRDEIGELGRSFNHMANSLEKMVRGGKELTANISHELRTPLTRLGILVELLSDSEELQQDGKLHPSVRNRMESMQEEIAHMDTLIGRILQLSKSELGQEGVLLRKPVMLTSLVEALVARHAEIINSKDFTLQCNWADDIEVMADDEVLSEVLENLIGNALKFSPQGAVITVDVHERNHIAEVTISNPAEQLCGADMQKLFTPFYRASSDAEGFGLGLTIARKGAERHGGILTAFSADGEFRICLQLPLRDDALDSS